ncbi:hypothetical protein ACF0H5_016908 [Mactra antiquata]
MSKASYGDKNMGKHVEDEEVDEDGYKTVKKRVGGGFKLVRVKVFDVPKHNDTVIDTSTKSLNLNVDAPDEYIVNDDEKQDGEETEKAFKDENEKEKDLNSESDTGSITLPLPSEDLWRDNTCDRGVSYDNYPILKHIQDSVIGQNVAINGPFGKKRLIYCDYTASGRSLGFIEDYIRTYVCPFYANTHSETGRNARQTSKFREEARQIIKKCVNASKDDVVIFTGSGATAGFHKLAWGLKINHQRVAEETVVLTGPYEHHANLLLWKEFGTTTATERSDCVI